MEIKINKTEKTTKIKEAELNIKPLNLELLSEEDLHGSYSNIPNNNMNVPNDIS